MALVEALKNNATLTALHLERVCLPREEGLVLAEALKTNTVLTELDVSDNLQKNEYGRVIGGDGPGFAKELAAGVSTNGALMNLNLANNQLRAEGVKHIAEAASKVNVSLLRF